MRRGSISLLDAFRQYKHAIRVAFYRSEFEKALSYLDIGSDSADFRLSDHAL